MKAFLGGLLLLAAARVTSLPAQEGGPSVGARAPVV